MTDLDAVQSVNKRKATYQQVNTGSMVVLDITEIVTSCLDYQCTELKKKKKKKKEHRSRNSTRMRSERRSGRTYTALRAAQSATSAARRIGGDSAAATARAAVETYRSGSGYAPTPPLHHTICPEIDHRGISRICTIPDSHFPFGDAVRSHVTD